MVTRCQTFVQRGSKGRRGQRENGCTAMAEAGHTWRNLRILHTHFDISAVFWKHSTLITHSCKYLFSFVRLWLWNRKLPALALHTGTYVTRKWATACCMSYCLDMNSRPGLFILSSKSVLTVNYYLYYLRNKITMECWQELDLRPTTIYVLLMKELIMETE